jgi:hypothetical protein
MTPFYQRIAEKLPLAFFEKLAIIQLFSVTQQPYIVRFCLQRRSLCMGDGLSQERTADRKQWSKPQLIVLGRGTQEEQVLMGCKANDKAGPHKNGCKHPGTHPNSCNSMTQS